MARFKKLFTSFWTIITILLAINIVVFSMSLVAAAEDLRVQYIPDDGFYYLTLARNFSSLGVWTFDSGISVTSGFHLLFAYLLAGIHSLINPDVNGFVESGILTGLLFALLSIAVLLYWGFRNKNILFLMFLTLVITSQNFIYNTVSITEWPIGVFISSLYAVWFFTRYQKPDIKSRDFFILFLLGLFSSLARSDSGLLSFSMFAAAFIFFWLKKLSKNQLYYASVGLAGTLTGLLIVFGHSFLNTNELLQSSARMKAYWGEFVEPSYYAAPVLIGHIIGVLGLLLLALMISAVILPRFIKKEESLDSPEIQNRLSPEPQHTSSMMLISSGICFMGYTLFYSRGGAIQPWYSGNLIIPVLLSIFALSHYLAVSLSDRAKFIFGSLFVAAVIFNIANLYPLSTENATWPYHQYLYEAGTYLSENPPDSQVGAWNAGIIGYYEGGHVINLDGLVNKDIFNYAINNDLSGYLSRENIVYIVDFERMISDETYRMRGGYDDADFVAALMPQMVFDEGNYGLTLYLIDREE